MTGCARHLFRSLENNFYDKLALAIELLRLLQFTSELAI